MKTILAALFLAGLIYPTNALADDEPYFMTDVQATVIMPPKWKMDRWSDWDFRAKSSDGVMMWLFITPYQVEPDETASKVWAKIHGDKLKEQKAGNIVATNTTTGERRNLKTSEITLEFRFNGDGPKGVYHAVALPAAGKIIHISTLASTSNDKKAREALEFFVDNLDIKRPAEDVTALSGVVGIAGFESDLPPGWRQPTKTEMTHVTGLMAKTGQTNISTESCWSAIRPLPDGDPDFALFCQTGLWLPKIDEYSWQGEEPLVHEKFFGKAPKPVEDAEKVTVGDRLGYLFKPPTTSEFSLMAAAPYDKGVMTAWATSQPEREKELDSAFRAILASTRFTGPEGGKPPIGFAGWLAYSVKYRPTNPMFFGPILLVLGLVGFIIVKLARMKPKEYNADDF